MNTTPHRTVDLQFTRIDGRVETVPIDVGIAELIELLWRCSIRTSSCCESEWQTRDATRLGLVHIQFDAAGDCERFLSIATDDKDGALYDAVMERCKDKADNFRFRFNVCDRTLYVRDDPEVEDWWNAYQHPIPAMRINCNVWFPPNYVDVLVYRFRHFLNFGFSEENTTKPTLQE